MARKSIRRLLLDANVVMALHTIGMWEQTVDRCEILLSEVVARKVKYFGTGERQTRIELESAFESASIRAASLNSRRRRRA